MMLLVRFVPTHLLSWSLVWLLHFLCRPAFALLELYPISVVLLKIARSGPVFTS